MTEKAETVRVNALTATEDPSTLDYFDSHVIEYLEERLEVPARLIREYGREGASVIDVGCGVGNTLEYLVKATDVREVAGMDISPRCLAAVERRLGCSTYLDSILDDGLHERVQRRFDFVVVAAVLHHLIGRNRRESRAHAAHAISNALKLLRPGGVLIIHEPVYSPRVVTGSLFWIKKGVTRLTPERVEVLSKWANIGPPVVSYLTRDQLVAMTEATAGVDMIFTYTEPIKPPAPISWVMGHGETTIAARLAS